PARTAQEGGHPSGLGLLPSSRARRRLVVPGRVGGCAQGRPDVCVSASPWPAPAAATSARRRVGSARGRHHAKKSLVQTTIRSDGGGRRSGPVRRIDRPSAGRVRAGGGGCLTSLSG